MVGIIILNYNNAPATVNCIESVLKYNTFPAKFIIVDNGSTDDSRSVIDGYLKGGHPDDYRCFNEEGHEGRLELPCFSLVLSKENGGYARGNNVGLRLADADDSIDVVMILNNDVLFVDDIIPELVSFAWSDQNIGLVSPLLLKRNGTEIDYNCARRDCSLKEVALCYLFYCRDRGGRLAAMADSRKILKTNPSLLAEKSVPIELPSGSCMLVRKDLFKKAGFFDPETFLYYEENILYHRFLSMGAVNHVLPELKCIHLGAETTTRIVRSYDYLRRSNRSAYYYVMHYRNLNVFQRAGFATLYAFYGSLLWLRQITK